MQSIYLIRRQISHNINELMMAPGRIAHRDSFSSNEHSSSSAISPQFHACTGYILVAESPSIVSVSAGHRST